MRLSLLTIAWAAASAAQTFIDLSGPNWTLRNSNSSITVPAELPSYATLDLYRARVIENPYYSTNEYTLRWIFGEDWTYVSDPIQDLRRRSQYNATVETYLVFDGLDTFTNIILCNQTVASTNNQFPQYHFNVTSILDRCSDPAPTLQLVFLSPSEVTQQISSKPGQEHFPPNTQFAFQLPNAEWARKGEGDFGRNYGPAFLPSGPWLPARAVQLASEELYVRTSSFDLYKQGQLNNLPPIQSNPWALNASIDVLGNIPAAATMKYRVIDCDNSTTISMGSLSNVNVSGEAHTVTGDAVLRQADYELWWPNGMGPQKMYNVVVDVEDASGHVLASST